MIPELAMTLNDPHVRAGANRFARNNIIHDRLTRDVRDWWIEPEIFEQGLAQTRPMVQVVELRDAVRRIARDLGAHCRLLSAA